MLDFPWPPIALLDQFKDQREMRDLIAQEAMADWAFWMMVLTAATTIVSLVSVYFLYQTFRQTRTSLQQAQLTTQHAQETAFIENRPWLMLFGPTFELTLGNQKDDEIRLDLSGSFLIKNDGKMPAVDIQYDVLLTQDEEVIDNEWKSEPVNGEGDITVLPPSYDNEIRVSEYSISLKPGLSGFDVRPIQFLIRVSYRSINDPSRILKTTGHGIMAERATFDPEKPLPITFQKIETEGIAENGAFFYSIKYMI